MAFFYFQVAGHSLGFAEALQIHGPLYISSGAQELCESRGGRPGLPVPNTPQ